MKFAIVGIMKRVVIGSLWAGVLAAAACADGNGLPTSPSASAAVSSLATSASVRSGPLHVTKECSAYTGLSGSFCTITSSNIKEIEVGSRIIYAQAADFTAGSLDSDVVLDPSKPGNNIASGHVVLDFATASGLVTIAGGSGKFNGFRASGVISLEASTGLWHWDGTYSFSPRD